MFIAIDPTDNKVMALTGWFQPYGNKPLSEAMLTKICDAIWCQQATVS